MHLGLVLSFAAAVSGADGVPFGIDSETLSLRLAPGVEVTAIRERIDWFAPDAQSFVGRVTGQPSSSVVLSQRRGEIWGTVRAESGDYRVRSGARGFRVEPLPQESRPERVLLPTRSAPAGLDRESGGDDGSEVDLLVVYTPKARQASGGHDAIRALVQLGVSEMNLALDKSYSGAGVRLVHLGEIRYEEAGDVDGDLELLQRDQDGAADEVHALRDRYGADLVQLVVEEGDGCGIAYVLADTDPGLEAWAFSVVERACVDASFGLAHELGHSLGSDHAPEDPTSVGAFEFSHGYKDFAAGFRSIMAYGPGRRIARFSNPRIRFRGEPVGAPLSDNARSIQWMRSSAARFRQSLPRPVITSPRPGDDLSAEALRFAWTKATSPDRRHATVDAWRLVVGTSPGARDLFDSGLLKDRFEVETKPVAWRNGRVFVRLWYLRGSTWLFEDRRY